jgi:hypothetical protein
LPTIFANWEQFESWFDFSDLQDEEGTEEFLQKDAFDLATSSAAKNQGRR